VSTEQLDTTNEGSPLVLYPLPTEPRFVKLPPFPSSAIGRKANQGICFCSGGAELLGSLIPGTHLALGARYSPPINCEGGHGGDQDRYRTAEPGTSDELAPDALICGSRVSSGCLELRGV
jgi:hypothetical protein